MELQEEHVFTQVLPLHSFTPTNIPKKTCLDDSGATIESHTVFVHQKRKQELKLLLHTFQGSSARK